MTPDDDPHVDRLSLDNDNDDADGPGDRSLWWALHRPETYAVAALALAVVSLLSLAPAYELANAIFLGGPHGLRAPLVTQIAVRGGIALIAIVLGVLAVRYEDEDVSWSAPVARGALVVGALSALLAVAALITTLATTPDLPGFTSPSP